MVKLQKKLKLKLNGEFFRKTDIAIDLGFLFKFNFFSLS
jgi:hypothetical protein